MSLNLGALLSLLVAFQLFFVALYLFAHGKGNKRNNSLLGVLFLLFAISWTDFTVRVMGVMLPLPLLHLLDDGFFFLYGPVLYFYVQGVVYRDFAFKKRHIIHLLPYLLYTSYLTYHVFLLDAATQSEIAQKVDTMGLPAWIYVVGILPYLHIVAYLWFSRHTILQYQTVIREKFSSVDSINLEWLSFMVKAFAAITVFALVHNVVPVFGDVFSHYSSLILLLIISFLFVNRVLVKALNQPAIFSGIAQEETEKYASSNLKEEALEEHKTQIEELLRGERLYLQPDLTSQDLAEQLDISTKTLSQVINQGFGKSFFDLVNTYRCEEVQRLLQGPDEKITIIEAMYQSGFNSKSSFNKEFKKLTGQTPSEFKKSVKMS